MGAVAGRLSDLILITSDNPRSEDPTRIIEEIQRGITRRHPTRQQPAAADDRRSPRGDLDGDRAGAARRSGAHRRQRAREVPGDRQLRCCRSTTSRSRGKRWPPAQQLRCRVGPMLYPPALPASDTEFSVLNVTRYITFRTAAASLSALAISLRLRPVDDPQAARVSDRPGDSAGGSDVASAQGRHADDGRAADPDGGARSRRCCGRTSTNVYVWIAVLTTAAFGARRIPRRLPEDRAARSSRPAAALQDGLQILIAIVRRDRAARAGAAGAVQHAADLPVLQGR